MRCFFFWKTVSLSCITSPINIIFFFTLYSCGKQLILAPTLSHSLTVSSQFSPFSLLFLSSHILTISLLWSFLFSVFTNLPLFVSHYQQLFLALVIFRSSLQKPQFYSLLSVSLTIYIVISCFYKVLDLNYSIPMFDVF